MFIVYTSPGCYKCRLTIQALTKAGLPVETRDVTTIDGAREEALELSGGRLELPIVKPPTGEAWSDFRRDKLKEYGA